MHPPEVIFAAVILLVFVVLLWCRRLPSMSSTVEFINALNSRGGNIILLGGLSAWFFAVSVRWFYFCMSLVVNKQLSPDNVIALQGITFVTGVAFGGAFGALLKSMNGDNAAVTKAEEPKKEVPVENATP